MHYALRITHYALLIAHYFFGNVTASTIES